jgi:hypothetical protein
VLFFGGQGGSPKEPEVRTQVGLWLRPYFLQGYEITERENQLRGDLIWWKERVAVVEIGVKISRDDVERAKTRANTLRQAGIDAFPVVIGEEWGTPEIEALAQTEGVEWYVRGGLSAGLLGVSTPARRVRRMSDLLIIGAGPIGLAAGIEAKRAGLQFLILEAGTICQSLVEYPDWHALLLACRRVSNRRLPVPDARTTRSPRAKSR